MVQSGAVGRGFKLNQRLCAHHPSCFSTTVCPHTSRPTQISRGSQRAKRREAGSPLVSESEPARVATPERAC